MQQVLAGDAINCPCRNMEYGHQGREAVLGTDRGWMGEKGQLAPRGGLSGKGPSRASGTFSSWGN